MSLRPIMAAAMLALTFTTPAAAQEMMDHGSMQGMTEPKGDKGPSSKAFAEANAKMHEGMDITFSGNTDVDFVRGMIAHHQGAIDMAKIELEYGKDAQLRKLAEDIISAQEAEIKMMKEWLARNGG
ncbi:CopM family metallochaperone [Pararhizobium sp. LjRoot238]|uniref:CopM family metallochaperone n=1 Tax=Pararhizobium sp. LjRoot238 TaxID=3342293 RepID=UPI003ECCE74A